MRLILPKKGSSSRSSKEMSDIHKFVYKNDLEAVRTCIRKSPTCIDIQDNKGMTPLIVAASLNRCDVMDLLLTSHCDVMITDKDGNTALHEGVDKGHVEVVEKLVKDRRIVDARNTSGQTPLMKAAFYDYVEIAGILLKQGCVSLDMKDNQNQTALLIGLREGSHVTVDLLLNSGSDVTAINSMGQTALYIAIYSPCNRTLDMARRLIAQGYDLTNDKMWLLNEERHNLFYQDDDFYSILRRKLRNNSNDHSMVNNSAYHVWSQSLDEGRVPVVSPLSPLSPESIQFCSPLSPPASPFAMSPTLKHRIMNTRNPIFPRAPFVKHNSVEKEDTGSSSVSILRQRKSSSSHRRPKLTLQKSASSGSDTSVFSPCDDVRSPIIGFSMFPGNEIQSDRNRSRSGPGSDTNDVTNYTDGLDDNNSPRNNLMVATPHVSSQGGINTRVDSKSQTRMSTAFSAFRKRFSSSGTMKTETNRDRPSVAYKRQISVQLPPRDVKELTPPLSRKVSVPERPSVHFSTEIKVVDLGRIH